MKKSYWTGYCKGTRLNSINKIENIISKYGFILNFTLFSDISISIVIETNEKLVDNLYYDIVNEISITDYKALNSISDNDYYVLLNITFKDSTGDLRIEVPNVPG